jgi:phage terminase large subunit GpA-like protein
MPASAFDILHEVAELALPPERITVPESSERNVVLDIKGGYYGKWENKAVPLMVEPGNCLTSRDYDSVIFVGPAQSAKTQMLCDNWAFHTIAHDPVDFLMVEKSESEARKHSKTKFDRVIQASPNLSAKLVGGHGSNVHEKRMKSGAFIWLKWPTKNTLSGATISRIALTDYDRMPDNIDGEGPAFGLAYARRTYFGSRGMVVAESSPSKPILDPKWIPATPHEAPPTIGILGLYNTGDRRRVYSQCPHCKEWITVEASPDVLVIPDGIDDERECAKQSSLICPANGCLIGVEHERQFKRMARWVHEGQTINEDGSLEDDGRRSRRASFWLPGWFAAFASWVSIISEYVMAKRQYERSGDEEALKESVNTKIGGPYWSAMDLAAAKGSASLETKRESTWERYHVPDGARVIMALVDVQKRSFEVGVIARGKDGERWVLERFSLRKTKADKEDIRPATRSEHWDEITERVLRSTYRLPDGLELRVHCMGVDSGGEEGVTEKAYDYWRGLSAQEKRRVYLVKGISTARKGILSVLTRPDSRGRKDRPTGGRGDVPVLEIVSNRAKDAVNNDLLREIPGRGYIHLPEWLSDSYFRELRSEVRDDKGRWKKIGARRNELWDHLYYEHGLWDHLTRGDNIRWATPPHWLAEMATNSNVLTAGQRQELKATKKKEAPPPKMRMRTRTR